MAGYPWKQKKYLIVKNNITLIEDCAHALGTKESNKHVGNYGIAGVFILSN